MTAKSRKPFSRCRATVSPDRAGEHRSWVSALDTECRMLIVLRDELYRGRWEEMLSDLEERLKGDPYLFKLVNRIRQDIERIKRFRGYENGHGINLKEFPPSPP